MPSATHGDARSAPVPPPTRRSFPREAQLRRTADYRRVYDQGTRRQFGWMAVFLLRTGNQPGRVGITVPRAFGAAVERNRMKRRLRHAIAACQRELPAGWDIVLHPRAAGLKLDFLEMQATLRKIFGFCTRRPAQQ